VVLCTFPDADTARQIGTFLVETQLAACVNLLPGVESIYRWQGAVETAGEVLVMLKTTAERLPELERELAARHPYETPEIVALRPEAVAERYAAWVAASVRGGSEAGVELPEAGGAQAV
jgi:periplasmic divalent cation tolerance protein